MSKIKAGQMLQMFIKSFPQNARISTATFVKLELLESVKEIW